MRALLTSAGLVPLVLFSAGCGPATPPSPADAPQKVAAPATNALPAPAASTVAPEFAKLKGSWRRPDGGYIIEIKDVLAGGRLSAAYYNPRSINVSQAEARKEAGAVKVFIELRDQNYPGATYNLTYDPEHDLLAGAYYQPMAGETYQIQFERQKEEGR